MKSFGMFLRYARKQRNLTQEQVAESLNIVTPVLSKWENDKAIPPLEMLCKLCNVLNVSIEECINSELSDGERELPPKQYQPEKLGETIKDLRIKNGWSQAEIGKKLFVTSQTVSKWEAGGISSLEILGKFAELFGLTPTEMLNGLGHNRHLPEKQTTAEQPKKTNRFILKITAIIIAVIIFLGAIAGLVVGLVLNSKGDDDKQDIPDTSQTEQPGDTPSDDDNGQQTVGDFVTPVNEFYSVKSFGQDNAMIFITKCMIFEIAVDTPVYAIADGTITEVSFDRIRIEHSEGFVCEYYYFDGGHEVGEQVKKGQQLGKASRTFHIFLYLDGEKVDPFEYITELPEPIPKHEHEFDERWEYDSRGHWHECACGEKDLPEHHTMENGTCVVCGYESPKPI